MARESLYPAKRLALLLAITEAAAHGRAPGIRDLAARLDVAVGTTHSYLLQARTEGLLTWPDGAKRKLALTPQGQGIVAAHRRAEALMAASPSPTASSDA